MYGDAIRNLKSDLAHPLKAYTIETLGATMALSTFEVCFCTSLIWPIELLLTY